LFEDVWSEAKTYYFADKNGIGEVRAIANTKMGLVFSGDSAIQLD